MDSNLAISTLGICHRQHNLHRGTAWLEYLLHFFFTSFFLRCIQQDVMQDCSFNDAARHICYTYKRVLNLNTKMFIVSNKPPFGLCRRRVRKKDFFLLVHINYYCCGLINSVLLLLDGGEAQKEGYFFFMFNETYN